MRQLGTGAAVSGSGVDLVDAATSVVTLTLATGTVVTFGCSVVGEWSRGGTVLQKDARRLCQ